ncbi:multiple epidermal growth factor-like domains protein 10, partial [Patella vulgata]|uniref:multiple epidermal growth factor-like domains protein 10 n=1 Tax=Patella vulgata TaxID=6465 RepID=UPI0021806C2B
LNGTFFTLVSGDWNVARNKPTTLSSVQWDGISSRAVDGNVNPDYNQGESCAHSDETLGPENKWLCVDLEESFFIRNIKIFNRNAYESRLDGFEIRLSSSGGCDSAGFTSATQCYKDDKTSPGKPVYTIERCNVEGVPSFAGRYVFISVGKNHNSQPAILTICELQIFTENCPVGYYGTNCQISCPQNCLNKECEKVRGGCSKGCLDGYYGDYCESSCNILCITNCKDNKCDWKTGICKGCEDGFYGESCNYPCSTCKDSCRQSDGICLTGCTPGYWGINGMCLHECPESCGTNGCKMNNVTCNDELAKALN